jgi:hypothetical protein
VWSPLEATTLDVGRSIRTERDWLLRYVDTTIKPVLFVVRPGGKEQRG